jgi:hypothetical protein
MLIDQTLLGLLPLAVSASSSPNIALSTDDDLPFGGTVPVLRIDALWLNEVTHDVVVVGKVLEALVNLFLNLSFVPGNRFELDMLFFELRPA